jgi:hypothetical protein
VNPFEQTLLFASTALILVGTMTAFAWQYFRNRGKGDR